MSAKAEILERVREALASSQSEPAPTPPREYRVSSGSEPGTPETMERFIDRLVDYKARVRECSPEELGAVLSEVLAGEIVVAPPGLPWLELLGEVDVRVDTPDAPLSHAELDGVNAALTAARLGIAESGVIVLDGEPDQGRRAITLVPDHHVCVVRRSQVVALVPEAVAILGEHPHRPTTWIAGPSATSDIELQRVEGVHGPRTLDVVIVGD